MTKEEKRIERLYKEIREDKIRRVRTAIINILVDDEIYLENIDYIIEEFCSKINNYLKN